MEHLFRLQSDIPSVEPDILFHVFGWPISNTFMSILVILLMVIVFCVFVVRRLTLVPHSKVQIVVELLYEGMVDLVRQITGNKTVAERITPLIASLFVFVGIANLLSLIPFLSPITLHGISMFRTPTADFNTTFGMAFAMILFVQISSISSFGFLGYAGRFLQFNGVWQGFKKGIGEGVMSLINFGIGLLDIISELAKIVSLSLRLFGNIYAGEVLVVILLGALAYAVPAIWMTASAFFGLIQAVVFGSLVAAYYASSINSEEVRNLEAEPPAV